LGVWGDDPWFFIALRKSAFAASNVALGHRAYDNNQTRQANVARTIAIIEAAMPRSHRSGLIRSQNGIGLEA
jgi:hypothetical protein